MKRHVSIAVVILALGAVLIPRVGAQEEQWLQYRSASEAFQIVGDMNYLYKTPTDSKPEGVEMPDFVSDAPLFLPWEAPMAKSGQIWLAFDKSSGGQYDRLYIDTNANGDLSDETAQEPSRRDSNSSYFGLIKIVFDTEDGPITYHLSVNHYWRPDRTYCLLRSACWYEGPITVNGVKKHCTLIDYNVNGLFNDKSTDSSKCDRIRIGEPEGRDTRFVGNYIEVDDKLYRQQVARDGAFIVLTEANDVAYGTIRVADNITSFAVGGENGLFTRTPKEGVARLPVGDYRFDYWSIVKKDDAGAKWELRGSRGGGLVSIAQDEEVELAIGEPVYSSVTVRKSESYYSFSQNLQGRREERIELLRNGSRPQPPKLRIRNRDGTYDRGMSFEYG